LGNCFRQTNVMPQSQDWAHETDALQTHQAAQWISPTHDTRLREVKGSDCEWR